MPKFACMSILYNFWIFLDQLLECWMWQMLLSHFLKPMEIFWQMLFAIYYVMADVIAIVANVNATIFVCGRWNHIRYFVVCGRCYSHTMNWLMLLPKWQMELPHMNGLMLLPNVADGTATYVTADEFVYCGRWNSHLVTGWCYCHGGRWNGHWLECIIVIKADVITLLADVLAREVGPKYSKIIQYWHTCKLWHKKLQTKLFRITFHIHQQKWVLW